jgi:hypothetical protein
MYIVLPGMYDVLCSGELLEIKDILGAFILLPNETGSGK